MQKWGWPADIWTNCTLLAPRFTQTRSHSGISSKSDADQRSHSFTKPCEDIQLLSSSNFELGCRIQATSQVSMSVGFYEPLISLLLLTVNVRFFFYDNLVAGATTLPTCSGSAFFYHFWPGRVLRKRWYAIYTHPLSDEGSPQFNYYCNRKSLSGIRKKIDRAFRNKQPCYKRVARKLN